MEDELQPGTEGAEGTDGADQPDGADRPAPPGAIPPLPPEVSTRQQEVRALVDAGAASPEELRALAEKLKEQRSYEESLWQRDVRPALVQARKKKPSIVDLRRDGVEGNESSIVLGIGLLVGALVVLWIATQTSFLLLLVPAAGVLVYAWVRGIRHGDQPGEPAPPPRPPDVTD